MNKGLLILLLINVNIICAQSKKEQIEILKIKLDSLINELDIERKLSSNKINLLNNSNSSMQNQVDSLNSELQKLKLNLNQKELDNKNLNKTLDNKNTVLNYFKNQILSKEDSIKTLSNELENLKLYIQNNKPIIPENNYDKLTTEFFNKQKDVSEIKKWIPGILDAEFTNKMIFTEKCKEYITDVIDFSSGYDGTISEVDLKKKWAKQFDLKYSKFAHIFETGNCGWATREIKKIEYLGELNKGDWFKLTIVGGCGEKDYSETIIRVIKVVKENNLFLLDNLISLSN